jgi:hypothetical protein
MMAGVKLMSKAPSARAVEVLDSSELLAELLALETTDAEKRPKLDSAVQTAAERVRAEEAQTAKALVPVRAAHAEAAANLAEYEAQFERARDIIRRQRTAGIATSCDRVWRLIVRKEQAVRESHSARSGVSGTEKINQQLKALAAGRNELLELWRHPKPEERITELVDELDLET